LINILWDSMLINAGTGHHRFMGSRMCFYSLVGSGVLGLDGMCQNVNQMPLAVESRPFNIDRFTGGYFTFVRHQFITGTP